MELRKLFNANQKKRRDHSGTAGGHTACRAHYAPMTASHPMPRILSEDVGVPELRVAHAMAARRMPATR